MTDTNTASGSQRRKYPSLNLKQAIEKTRMVFERERYNSAPVEIVARHMGFKNLKSGPASSGYSALKQFGLLDEQSTSGARTASISQRARAILTAPDDVKEREIREAALAPPINKLIWERYGADTGSTDSFVWTLVSELGFSDRGAKEFARQYDQTIRFAKLDQFAASDNETEQEPEDEDLEASGGSASEESATQPAADDRPPKALGPLRSDESTQRIPGLSRHAIPLIGGQQVVLEGAFPLSEAAWEGFLAVLNAFKPGLVVALPPSTARDSGSDHDGPNPRRG